MYESKDRAERKYDKFAIPVLLTAIAVLLTNIVFDIMRIKNIYRFISLDILMGILGIGYPLAWLVASLVMTFIIYYCCFDYEDNNNWVKYETEMCKREGKEPPNKNENAYLVSSICCYVVEAVAYAIMLESYAIGSMVVKFVSVIAILCIIAYRVKLNIAKKEK